MNRYIGWIFSLLMLTACDASAQLINFDDVPDGTDISSHYPGLTFSCAGSHCASTSIFARQPPPLSAPAASPPNVVSPANTGPVGVHNPTTGTIKVQIACLATKVTIKGRSTPVPEPLNQVQHAILVAQDSSGAAVGQATGTMIDQYELLTVNNPPKLIATIFLGVEGTGVAAVAQFDDLSVECAPTVTYPHYTIIWLFIIAFIVIFVLWRHKRP